MDFKVVVEEDVCSLLKLPKIYKKTNDLLHMPQQMQNRAKSF